ncbi:tripartite tricarboxylate transporter substrate binding protein [Micromonospora sp. STR1s_5]|nr:tripartite tricarboxylate transporter substrate binding protein [Micromonospora sp. STR1s_5]
MALRRRDFLRFSATALAVPAASRFAEAQSYPSRPVRIIVGFPAGGPVDIAARVISPWLSARLGQPFVVENRPGKSGNLATREVVRAAPDGHTLLLCGPVNTINTTLFTGLDFDFTHDLKPVASISRVPLVVEVHPSVEARSVSDFLALAKTRPGAIRVAYAGNGTPQHIGIELLKMMAGVDLRLVPYLGSAPALADLLEGRVDAMFDPLPSSIAHIRAGRLIALAVTTPTPSEALSDVPAMSSFVPGYEAGSWFGLASPRSTPEAIVGRLNAEVRAGLIDPEIAAKLGGMGAAPLSKSVAEFSEFIALETARYAEVIRVAGIRAS